ncbi:hypothetical protein [Marinomonas gallaica]|uniref:hypothetical protein n=1 Tax=Marinomonas gallaica TaxID=1806667 RepID=UPI003A93264E
MDVIKLGLYKALKLAHGLLGVAIFIAVVALIVFIFSSVLSFIGILFISIGIAIPFYVVFCIFKEFFQGCRKS